MLHNLKNLTGAEILDLHIQNELVNFSTSLAEACFLMELGDQDAGEAMFYETIGKNYHWLMNYQSFCRVLAMAESGMRYYREILGRPASSQPDANASAIKEEVEA